MSPNRDFRLAGHSDARAIAALHADSWRRHYRGVYSDAFLDGDVAVDRLAVWTDRLGQSDPGSCTMLAEDGSGLIGFAHTVFDEDPMWGALLDNIHVAHTRERRGVGSGLLARIAEVVAGRPHRTGLCLWVNEQNIDAQAFYEAHGARRVERAMSVPPEGSPAGLMDRRTSCATRGAIRARWPDRVDTHRASTHDLETMPAPGVAGVQICAFAQKEASS